MIRTRPLGYLAGDTRCEGYLAAPDDRGRHPGVLVAHEGPGLDRHARSRAEMLAELGYVALAVDLHGAGHVAASHEETIALVGALLEARAVIRVRVRAGLDALRAEPAVRPDQVAAIGYCFGGTAVLELARSGAPVLGTVTFHGLLTTPSPEDAANIRGSVLACTGAADHLVPPAQVDAFEREMSAAGVDWQVIRYGGAKHAFTNRIEAEALGRLGFGYDARADRRSWAAMQDFLAELFGRAPDPARPPIRAISASEVLTP